MYWSVFGNCLTRAFNYLWFSAAWAPKIIYHSVFECTPHSVQLTQLSEYQLERLWCVLVHFFLSLFYENFNKFNIFEEFKCVSSFVSWSREWNGKAAIQSRIKYIPRNLRRSNQTSSQLSWKFFFLLCEIFCSKILLSEKPNIVIIAFIRLMKR